MYMDVHKEGTGHLYPFLGEERGKKLQRHLTNFLLEQYYRHFRVFGCTSFVHIPAQLREKLSPRKPLVSFLDMLSPGIDAMTWNPRDSMYPWMFSLMGALHIFLNLINKPRGIMMMEMYCGLLLFINSNRILCSWCYGSASRFKQLCSASSADCQPVQLTSEDSSHPAQHVYSRQRLQSLSQGQTTP